MINLRVLVPEATINYVTNPAFRYNTDGWNVQGAALTRSLDFARFGIASGKVVTSGLAQHEGTYFRVSALAGISENVTVSIYLRGTGKVRLRLDNNVVGGGEIYTPTIELNPSRWTRHEVSIMTTGGNDVRLWVESDDVVARAYTFYIDGAQMERKPYATSYCDGDQPGCRWNIVSHGSISTRTADTRKGGRWVPLAGPCRSDNDIYVTLMGGFGMPPIQNQKQSWAQVPGSYYQNQKVLDRVVLMSFHVKDENLRAVPPAQLKNLHNLRQQIVDLFKSDLTLNDEPFLFEYSETEADRPLYIEFRYESGLEGNWDIRNGWFNSFTLRMIAVNPLFSEDNQNVQQLGIKTSYPQNYPTTLNSLLSFSENRWSVQLNMGFYINAMAEAPDGSIYLGGTSSIRKWDGVSLTTIGTLTGGGAVCNSLEVSPDGTLYATGSFTAINGVAAANIAKYNPITSTWTAMGTGLNGSGFSICIANNGQVYVGGGFSTAGGVTCQRIARWDGLQWRTVGNTSGVDNSVFSIIKGDSHNILYIGGSFSNAFGTSTAYNNVASVNTTTNLIDACGYGLGGGGAVYALALGKDGILYAGGTFQTSGSPGTGALLRIAQWNGGQLWKPVGSGLNNAVYSLAIGKDGELYAFGDFTLSGTLDIKSIGKWFQGAWTHLEINMLNSFSFSGRSDNIIYTKNGDLLVSLPSIVLGTFASINIPYYNTITNDGTAEASPKMYILGQGTIRFIGNTKTGQGIYLNLEIQSGEEVFIDFARGTIESTVRGSLLYTILPGSEIRSINLLPGDNTIGLYVTNDVNCIAQVRYVPQHWSADAVVDAEAMV